MILDDCRAIPIRWKGFPRIAYERTHGFKKDLAEFGLQAGTALSAVGIPGNPLSAICVRRLYGGTVLRCSPLLVGFEGVMLISDLEKLVFGNDNYRLKVGFWSHPPCGCVLMLMEAVVSPICN